MSSNVERRIIVPARTGAVVCVEDATEARASYARWKASRGDLKPLSAGRTADQLQARLAAVADRAAAVSRNLARG